ncbi:MAG TPA: phage holin family protein [Gemmatimonadaceae bacterium]|nr:phage holin family protein [Gemmatimonadaceae bacterium]
MTVDRPNGRRGVGALLRELAEGSATLVRKELALAKLELATAAKSIGRGTALVATGGVLALLGALALIAGLILLAGDQWLRDRYWLAALIVTLIAGAAAALLARRGAHLLSPKTLAPRQTVATLKEDKEWLKRQLTSGATSR